MKPNEWKELNRYTELGEFLKACRNKIKPEQMGLSAGTRRRIPGLRREEVAQLAGMGLTWYTWLEQGRAINVSDAVLDSLSRVFLLTNEERRHLYALANKSVPKPTTDLHIINDRVIHFFNKLDLLYCPAYINDSRWNIIKWNKYADAVFGDFSKLPAHEQNTMYLMFCNEQYMSLFEHWELHAQEMLARFHAAFARNIDDPWYNDFIQDMKNKCPQFASWWALYNVNSMTNIIKNIKHPTLGALTFDFLTLDIHDSPNLTLVIYNPDHTTSRVLDKMSLS
jgi:transcriptional regulator with XRE-family HTH domain